MINFKRKEDCCGCSSCAGVCPKKCISILPDKEGFYYPIIDDETCINCGLCESVCPVINCKDEIYHEQKGYVVQNKNKIILKESTSGGAFTGFAEYIIKQDGVVVGATLNNDLVVEHVIVDNIKDLSKFRNSKYVQSYISPDIYTHVKSLLKEGITVCFSGTGCQIEALRNFLGDKEYGNLISIDVVCRAVPSPLAFKKYIEYQISRNHADIENLRFRDKHFGYHFSTLNIGFKGIPKHYHRGIESDPWHRAFFSGICNRPSCHECIFKKRYRVSDITIWDCFNYESLYPGLVKNLGATNVLIHSQKGLSLFQKVKDAFIVEVANPDEQVAQMKELTQSVPPNTKRDVFLKDAQILDGLSLYNKYFPIGMKNKMLYLGRVLATKAGVYNAIKAFLK